MCICMHIYCIYIIYIRTYIYIHTQEGERVRELEEQLQQAATELQQMQQEGERVRELEEQLQQAATELQQMQQQLSEV
jgi:hypothetical protein